MGRVKRKKGSFDFGKFDDFFLKYKDILSLGYMGSGLDVVNFF